MAWLRSLIVSIAIPALSVSLSFLVASMVILLSGHDPMSAFSGLFQGAIGDLEAVGRTLEKATPLIWNGLALTLAFKSGLFNIGVQGQFLLGALFSAVVGTFAWKIPAPLHLVAAIGGGVLAGALYGMIQGVLKAYREAHEVITGIMFNYIAINLTDYLTKGPFMDRAADNLIPRTPMVVDGCRMPEFASIPMTFLLAIITSLCLFVFLETTVKGFEIRAIGEGVKAARSVMGLRIPWMMMSVMILSGALAGAGGAMESLGVTGRFQPGFNLGLGFEGITIALLARGNPLGVIPAAILLGAMKAGASAMQFASDVPTEMIDMMISMILLCVAAEKLTMFLLPFKKTSQSTPSLGGGWGGGRR